MNEAPQVKVIQTKRSPPIWSVKVGARFVDTFTGGDAKERALKSAEKHGRVEIVERPALKRAKRKPS